MKLIKSKIISLIIIGAIGMISIVPLWADTRVKGYYRKDGTYVKPHWRSSPNSSVWDNWSTKGNVNPYTQTPPSTYYPAPSFNTNVPSTNSLPPLNYVDPDINDSIVPQSLPPLTQINPTSHDPVDVIRSEAFQQAYSMQTRDLSAIPSFDPNYLENAKIRNKKIKNNTKRTLYDYINSYGIVNESQDMGFYYSNTGSLYAVDYYIGETFPKKIFQYSYPNGQLMNIGVWENLSKGYLFNLQGGLITFWDNIKARDPSGNVMAKRKIYEPQ